MLSLTLRFTSYGGKHNDISIQPEIVAERVAVIQSLLVTRRLQGVDPYAATYK